MTFYQKITRIEDGHGRQSVVFVLSDTYEGLFSAQVATCDVFDIESVKRDFNLEESSFAIDAFTFGINQAATMDDPNNANALWFALGSADAKVNRFCATFMTYYDASGAEVERTVDNIDFIGRLETKQSGTDKLHVGDEFATMIRVLRDYKFSAVAFDVAVLEKALFTAKIYDEFNNVVDNVYDRLRANDWALIKPLFAHRPLGRANNRYQYYPPLGNQFDVLRVFLDVSQQIITQLTGASVVFNLIESPLGFSTEPVRLTKVTTNSSVCPDYFNFNREHGDTVARKPLRLSSTEGADYYVPYIHCRMVSAEINAREEAGKEHGLSLPYEKQANMSDLLYAIAKFYGCYLTFKYVGTNAVNVQFVSRKAISGDAPEVLIKDATSGTLETANTENKDSQYYYGTMNDLTCDGLTQITLLDVMNNKESAQYTAEKDAIKIATEKKEKYERLIHSLSSTMAESPAYEFNWPRLRLLGQVQDVADNLTAPVEQFADTNYDPLSPESVQTAIFIKCDNPDADKTPGTVWRTANRVYVQVDGEDQIFATASDYINAITQHDKTYYDTTYELEVPFWNGFKTATGAPSWKFAQLGARTVRSEPWSRFNPATGAFESGVNTRVMTIVGIERFYNKISTKVKLQSISRFAFGDWDGNPAAIGGYTPPASGGSGAPSNADSYCRLAPTTTSVAINAVYKLADETIAPAVPLASCRLPFGFILTAGAGGDRCPIQTTGSVVVPDGCFTRPNVRGVYMRVPADPTRPNISDELLTEKSATEDTIVVLGYKDSATSFVINIDSFILD